MEESGQEAGEIEFHIGDYLGDAEGVCDVGFSGFAALALVGGASVVVGLLQERDDGGR